MLSVHVGDDQVDKDAFRAIKDRGLSVCVGNGSGTLADYYVKNIHEVVQFLQQLVILMKGVLDGR